MLGTSAGRSTLRRWSDSPAVVGVVATLVSALFAGLRYLGAANHSLAGFVLAGSANVDRATLAPGVPVMTGPGYDGEFYYRLAIDPFDWVHNAHGVILDSPIRLGRIGYPALAWLASGGGRVGLVPLALIAVNVLAVGLVAGTAAALARDAGRHAAWGLVLAGYFGFLWTLSRDLTELVSAAALLGGLLALRRRRPVVAGVVLAAGVLTRETVLVAVAAVALTRVLVWTGLVPRRRLGGATDAVGYLTHGGPGWADAAWVLPVAAFAAWQGAVWSGVGSLPIVSSGNINSDLPFVGFAGALRDAAVHMPQTASLLWFGEIVVLLLVVVGAGVVFGSTRAAFHERVAWIGYCVLSITLGTPVWQRGLGFRYLDEWFLMSCVLLLFTTRRLRIPAAAVAAAYLVVFVELVRFI